MAQDFSTSSKYYYARGRKIPIEIRPDLVGIRFKDGTIADRMANLGRDTDGVEPVEEFAEMQKENVRIFSLDVAGGRRASDVMTDLRRHPDVLVVGPVATFQGRPMIVTQELVVKFDADATAAAIKTFLTSNGLEQVRTLGHVLNGFVLRVADPAFDAVDLANRFVESGKVVYAYPNFVEYVGYRHGRDNDRPGRRATIPTDPMFNQQWYHQNTGQNGGTNGADISTPDAWDETMGDPDLVVAVIDGGTDISHSDLSSPGKVVSPINLQADPPTNDPLGGSHGTRVAGMAVGSANNDCAGVGSAPDCRLMPIRAGDTLTQIAMSDGFVYAADNGADVITCSLGPNNSPWVMTDALQEAIDYATTFGRNGRGCVYTHAVDNANVSVAQDEVCSYERNIAVGRTNDRDRPDGSARGPELDISAPGANVLLITNTTDTENCTTATSSGTSYATPLTAGVAALVLSRNTDLSWQEVRQVLFDTADKIDTANNPYMAAPPETPGTRNDALGHGRVNAWQAVLTAPEAGARDLWLRDTTSDTGSVPQPASGFWNSPDIWVRNADDGGTSHQNTIRGQDNWLQARVRNRGTAASHAGWVRFIITTFAGTEFIYPFDYKLDTTANPAGGTPGGLRPAADFPALGSYLIDTVRVGGIPAGGATIVKTRWPSALIPPDVSWHPCLLVEISPHDGPVPSGNNVWDNNNLGQKNITIVDGERGRIVKFPVKIGSLGKQPGEMWLDIIKPDTLQGWGVAVDPRTTKLFSAIVKASTLVPNGTPIVEYDPTSSVTTPFNGLTAAWAGSGFEILFPKGAAFGLVPKRPFRDGEEPAGLMVELPPDARLSFGTFDSLPADAAASNRPLAAAIDYSKVFGGLSKFQRPSNVYITEGSHKVHVAENAQVGTLKVPRLPSKSESIDIEIAIPANAKVGEVHQVDIVQRDATGRHVVGGVTLQINIVR